MGLISSNIFRSSPVCPLCGTTTCGEHIEVIPVDDPIYLNRSTAMTAQEQNQPGASDQPAEKPEELQTYTYTQFGTEVTGQLNEEDAKRLGAKRVGGEAKASEPGDERGSGSKVRKTPPANK